VFLQLKQLDIILQNATYSTTVHMTTTMPLDIILHIGHMADLDFHPISSIFP
jgi:hypothetical protein